MEPAALVRDGNCEQQRLSAALRGEWAEPLVSFEYARNCTASGALLTMKDFKLHDFVIMPEHGQSSPAPDAERGAAV
jgi:hypothetical protein